MECSFRETASPLLGLFCRIDLFKCYDFNARCWKAILRICSAKIFYDRETAGYGFGEILNNALNDAATSQYELSNLPHSPELHTLAARAFHRRVFSDAEDDVAVGAFGNLADFSQVHSRCSICSEE